MFILFESFLIFLFNFLIYKSIMDSLFLSFFIILTLYSMRVYDEVNWDIQKQFSRTFASSLLILFVILLLKPIFN